MYWKYADIFKEMKGMGADELTSNLPRMLETLFGQCRLPLDHRGTVSIVPDDSTIEIPEWTPGDGGCGTQTVAQWFDNDTPGGGSGPPASLFVGSPGIAGNQSVNNSGSGPPTVTGGYATYLCGNNYTEVQIVEELYVKRIFLFGGGTAMEYWIASGDEGPNQNVLDQQIVEFNGQEDGPIKVVCRNPRIVEIQDNGKIKLSEDDEDWDYFEEKTKDGDVEDMEVEDLVIKVEIKPDAEDEEIRWYIDASEIEDYDVGIPQVLGHAAGVTWKWFEVKECP